METVIEQLTGNKIADALVQTMADHFEDFAEAKKRYEDAMQMLRDELGADCEPSIAEVEDAIKTQTASSLLFSGLLGMKANMDNFVNPMTRNFLDVDSETYLRESTAHRLPEYVSGQKTLDRFFALLSPEQEPARDDIIAYICHLETVGPKLAHFCGFLLGNEFLYRVIPGYHVDMTLTVQYHIIMKRFFSNL